MHTIALEAFRIAKEAHEEIYKRLQVLEQDMKKATDVREHADIAFAMRESLVLLEDTVKHMTRVKETSGQLGVALWVKQCEEDSTTARSVKTEYCTATPEVKLVPVIPKLSNNPDAYHKLMASLGVPREAYEPNEVVRIHWPGIVAHTTALTEQGKPMPDGLEIDKTYTKFGFNPIRKRKELTAE